MERGKVEKLSPKVEMLSGRTIGNDASIRLPKPSRPPPTRPGVAIESGTAKSKTAKGAKPSAVMNPIDCNGINGRGERIRTTDLLVPNHQPT